MSRTRRTKSTSNTRSTGTALTGGLRKGFKLNSASLEVRPTSGRLREALFSILGQDQSGKSFLDLYAGFGSVGLEAASRGASQVTLVEHHPKVFEVLKKNCRKVDLPSVMPVKGKAESFPIQSGAYDVVFIDPPFSLDFESMEEWIGKWRRAVPAVAVQWPARRRPGWADPCGLHKNYGESDLGIFYN